jgi:hypothetical protein
LRSFAARVNLGPTVHVPSPKTLAWLAGALALLLLASLSPRAVPFNMDELVHYHALGCATAPLQRELPLIRDGCGYHDLRLPFTETPLPLRSYLYTGSFPVLPFYPFWLLLDDPVSARVQGAVFFLLVVLMAARLLRARPSSVLLAALVYPVLLASFLVDEGPVGLSAVLLLGALLAARRALASAPARASAAWAALAGFLLFLGLWTKLVFAWWLPAAVAFAVAEVLSRAGSWRAAVARHHRAALAGMAALCLPTALLLASVDRAGRPYAAVLREGKVSAEPERVEAAAGRLTPYLVDGSRVAPRNLLLPRSLVDPLPLALAAGVLLVATRRGGRRRAVAAWTAGAALTFALASSSEYSQWPHHFAFPLLLLVFALALALDGFSGRARGAVAMFALLFWATLAARWPSATFPGESSPAKDELLRVVRARGLDRGSLQLHTSWGTYYIAQLFGDRDRLLLYMRGATDDPKRLETARSLAEARGRSVLLVSSRRWQRIQTPAVAAVLGRPRATWLYGDWWAVEYDSVRPASPRP